MITKLIGSITVLIGTLIFGLSKSLKLKMRYKNIETVINCFDFLVNEISLNNDSLDDIFLRVCDVFSFREMFYHCAKKNKDEKISNRWKKAVEEDYRELYFTNEDKEILMLFSETLGKTDKHGQINSCKRIKNMLEKPKAEAYKEYKEMSKVYRNMSLMVGLFIVIVML